MDPGFPPPRRGPSLGGPSKPFAGGGKWPVDDDPTEPRKMYWDPKASPPRLTRGGLLVNSLTTQRQTPVQAALIVVVVADTVAYGTLVKKEIENLILLGKQSQGFTAVFDHEAPPDPKIFPELHALFAGESTWAPIPPPGPFKTVYTVRFDQA